MSNTTVQNTTLDADIQETITSETTQGTTNNASDDPKRDESATQSSQSHR